MTATNAPGGAAVVGAATGQPRLFNLPQEHETSDDHYTPQWLFNRLNLIFDIDVASPPGGPLFVPCKRFYTQTDDGLNQPWKGMIWMNPPFSNTTPWVQKFIQHKNGIALLPIVKSQWFYDIWDSDAAIVRADPDKSGMKFIHKGKEKRIFPSVILAAFGQTAISALTKANFGKVR